MAALLQWKIPLLIHQPSYNLLNRWVDKTGLLDTLEANGTGCIAFTAGAGSADRKIPERYSGRFSHAARGEQSARPDAENADGS